MSLLIFRCPIFLTHLQFSASSFSPSPQKAAPILCAGVTTYSGIKATETRPGQFLTVIGAAGGLGHLAVQYGVAMGLRVLALDVGADKLDFCMNALGAEAAFEATDPEVAAHVIAREGGRTGRGYCRDGTICYITLPCDLLFPSTNQTTSPRPSSSLLPLSLPPFLPALPGDRGHQGRLARRPLPRFHAVRLQVRRGALPSRGDDCDGWDAERRFAIEYF